MTLQYGKACALTSDHETYLVAPWHYLESAKSHWKAYRTRLFPPRHRETRIHDNLQGLVPDVTIHITTSIHTNVSLLEQMSAAEVWMHALHRFVKPHHHHTSTGVTRHLCHQQPHTHTNKCRDGGPQQEHPKCVVYPSLALRKTRKRLIGWELPIPHTARQCV